MFRSTESIPNHETNKHILSSLFGIWRAFAQNLNSHSPRTWSAPPSWPLSLFYRFSPPTYAAAALEFSEVEFASDTLEPPALSCPPALSGGSRSSFRWYRRPVSLIRSLKIFLLWNKQSCLKIPTLCLSSQNILHTDMYPTSLSNLTFKISCIFV